MKIVIPMSGIGKRFLVAGYTAPKPLIEIDGKPIIEHVVALFSGEKDFIFICNENHLRTTNMRQILSRIAPHGQIISIPPHKKGPVFAVSQIFDFIPDNDEIIVNYCDFGTYWDYHDFLDHTRKRHADGAIPAYKNFHPHMLGTTNYAFIRDHEQWLIEIREKEPFTNNRMQEYASNGTYYFKLGSLLKKYFTQLMDKNIQVKDEFYASMVYNLLVEDGHKVSIYEIQHMLQWGTPEDVQDYVKWSAFFKDILQYSQHSVKQLPNTVNLIPMAGLGQRFTDQGYALPKPLIEVSGFPMIIQASASLPAADKHIFVCQKKHLAEHPIKNALLSIYPTAKVIGLENTTEGQACTCEIGLKDISPEVPVLIGACDNGMLWDHTKYQDLLDDLSIDVIVWTFKDHKLANKHPQMYGWVQEHNGLASSVSVKKAISKTPEKDHGIVGTFFFRKAKYFSDALKGLYTKNKRINNEFYVDSCIEEAISQNLKVKVFQIEHYVCWGTPNDLRTFEYWQSFFHKCPWHPYRIENDPTVNPSKYDELKLLAKNFKQNYD